MERDFYSALFTDELVIKGFRSHSKSESLQLHHNNNIASTVQNDMQILSILLSPISMR